MPLKRRMSLKKKWIRILVRQSIKRADSSKEAIIRYKLVPRSNYTYYFFTPATLIPKQDYSVLVKGKWLPNNKTFTQRQLWQLTDNTENQENL